MKIKSLLLSLAAVSCMIPSQAQTIYNRFGTDDISDLALIYIGGRHRPDWNKERFRPYVVHTYADGHKSWMFDGFLMLEFMTQDESGKIEVSFGEYRAGGAVQSDWEWLLGRHLGLDTGLGCKALDELIGELKQEMNDLTHKHKVVLSVPVPVDQTATWGRINGKPINFAKLEDKITAMKWYADLVKEKWAAANFQNIELEGLYWVSEEMKVNGPLVKAATEYYHSIGLKAYWIPYSNAANRNNWEEFGFDMAYTQPNYYFSTETPLDKLIGVLGESMTYGLGVEMEWEGYNFSYNGPGQPLVQYPRANCGLYDFSPAYYQRLVDYIDWFERFGVFANSSIAYYAGYQAVYDFAQSSNPKDHEVMDRLASLLEERHIKAGWHDEKGSVDAVEISDREIAYGAQGYIYIAETAGNDVTVCTIDGRTIDTSHSDDLTYGKALPCSPGIYIVSTPARSVKVIVR